MPSSPILDYLDSLRARFGELSEGNVASYIPELAGAAARRDGEARETWRYAGRSNACAGCGSQRSGRSSR